MLAAVGAESIDALFEEQVPSPLLRDEWPPLTQPMAELDLLSRVRELASSCLITTERVSFLGGGCYDHFIPAALDSLASRSEFVTAYTPYQPEASQGTLQAFFEYQTLIARLYAMDASNASLYDGASALGEAVFLALAAQPDKRRIVLPFALHPQYRQVLKSYVAHHDVEVVELPAKNGVTDPDALEKAGALRPAALVAMQPNYFGCLEDVELFRKVATQSGALLIAVADPFSLGLLAPPGDYGADIAVGEGQPLGLRQYWGGETLGIFTCRKDFVRRMPGRLVGLTRDRNGKRGYVLTLQTREQHIRRDKATSNICTNHALNALRAAIYLSLIGPTGLRRLARQCARNLAYFRKCLSLRSPAAVAFPGPAFRETVVRLKTDAREALPRLLERGFFGGVPLTSLGTEFSNLLLVAVTEKRTDAEIESFVTALAEEKLV
jgi:glycine dehydrogenase subunit 1